jgi:hypothetical protein
MYPQAIKELGIYAKLSDLRDTSEIASAMEQGFRSAGWKGALTRRIEILLARRKTGYAYASPYRIASLYAGLGDKEQAFRWLNIAYQEHDWQLEGLNSDFYIDPLRSDPRFAALVRKVGLPQ